METVRQKTATMPLIAGIAIALFFYPVVGQLAFAGKVANTTMLFESRLLIWLEVGVLFIYAHKAEKMNFMLWADERQVFWFYPASFVCLYFLALISGAIANIPAVLGWHDNNKIMQLMLVLANKNGWLLLFSAITAGFTEELIFRAYLVPRLEMLFKNKASSIIISSLMFSAIHYRYFNLKEIIFTFCIGLIFAIHYQMYRNIKVLIFTHAFIDLVAFLLFRLMQANHIHTKGMGLLF